MPVLSKEMSDQYDSSVKVFHNHASNQNSLNTWIDKLIVLTRKTSSSNNKDAPSTESFVESIQRYNAVFMELIRQTNIFSETLSKLYAKTWNGSMTLLDNMIKTYHKYVRSNMTSKSMASRQLKDKAKDDVAMKNKEEDYILERTVLRARIRGLEAEIDSMRITGSTQQNEVKYLRIIVDEYIRSGDANGRASATFDSSDTNSTKNTNNMSNGNKGINGNNSEKSSEEKVFLSVGFGRKDTIEIGRQNLRVLTGIESDMSNVLCALSKEEDRQTLILEDIKKLIDKNQAVFSSSNPPPSHVKGVLSLENSHSNYGKKTKEKSIDIGIQVDEKDSHGAINNNEDMKNNNNIENDDTISDDEDDVIILPPSISEIEKEPSLLHINGLHIPYKLRKLMHHFPKILRIPTLEWLNQTIMAIYVFKIYSDDEKEKKQVMKLSLAENVYEYFFKLYGLPAVVDVQV